MSERASSILVVEDEPAMSSLLQQALEESGFDVAVASNGYEGLCAAPQHDLVIADVMMPVMNGFEMVRRLREAGHTMPVLLLTAKDEPASRVKGLDLGADDYLGKPFELAELLARTRALLRRARHAQDELEWGDLTLDTRSRRVQRAGEPVYLSNTEFAILELLMHQPGVVVSKQTLLRDVWDEDARRDDNVVEVYINYLRNKLEAKGGPRVIHTRRGRGYVLEAPDGES